MHPSIGLLPPPGNELPVEGFRKMLTQIKLQLLNFSFSRFHVVSYNSPMTQTLTILTKHIYLCTLLRLGKDINHVNNLKFECVLPGGLYVNVTVHSEHVACL